MRALIDSDELCYLAAYGCTDICYSLVNSKGEILGKEKNKSQAIQLACNLNIQEDFSIMKEIEDLGIDRGYEHIDKIINSILSSTGCNEYSLFSTGKNVFRFEFATILPYKGNRENAEPPLYLKELKEYMIEEKDSVVVDYLEADDLLAINQSEDTVLVSQDKDLNMVPGKRYNFHKDEFKVLTEPSCTRFHYFQMLTGDRTDNIPGLHLIGPKKADKILDEGENPKEWYNLVLQEYTTRMKLGKQRWTTSKAPSEVVYEIANLLYMRRELGKEAYWEPPR